MSRTPSIRRLLPVPTALPDFLVEAEQAADQRYGELGCGLHLPWHIAAHALASYVCAQLNGAYKAAMPGSPDQYHDEARDRLEALHFALRALPRPRRPVVGEFDASHAARHLDERALSAIGRVLDEMAGFVRIRDALNACWAGMFTGRLLKPATIRFDLVPEWRGGKLHAAGEAMHRSIEYTDVRRIATQPSLEAFEACLNDMVRLPRDIPLVGIDSGVFIDIHHRLRIQLGVRQMQNTGPLLRRDDVALMVRSCGVDSHTETERYVDLVTYDPECRAHIDLFCCPLLRLTELSFLLVSPALFLANLRYVIPRLAVHRGPGLDAYSERMESYLVGELQKHYSPQGVVSKARFEYHRGNDKGDIDLAMYDRRDGALTLAQVKAFVPPDSVVDVLGVNEKLAEGTDQAQRAREWFLSEEGGALCSALGIGSRASLRRVLHVVIGNGFAGSDYLPAPDDIATVASDFLLLPRYHNGRIAQAIDDHTKHRRTKADAASDVIYQTVSFGGWSFEMPAIAV